MVLNQTARLALLESAQLARQSFGIATAGNTYGGPRGIWLNCTACRESQVIVGSAAEPWDQISDEEAAKVFTARGWSGEGAKLLAARCPRCSAAGRESSL